MCQLIKPIISLLVLWKAATCDIIASSHREDICCSVPSTQWICDVTASRGNWATVFVSLPKLLPCVLRNTETHSPAGSLPGRVEHTGRFWHHHPQPRSCNERLGEMDVLCANTWKSRWSRSGAAHLHDCGLSIIFPQKQKAISQKTPDGNFLYRRDSATAQCQH